MANNQVRGITVEIGGDTTKLGKALQSAETQSRSLQKELKQINTALKLDPSNVELAAQKQKVLKEQIEATKEKLDILKKAESEITRQFKAGQIGEEQFRAFKRELTQTESELKKYQSELEKTNKKTTALEKLTTTIDKQEDEVAKLKQQYKEAVVEYGKNSTEAKRLAGEISSLSGELRDNKQKMADADKAADDLDKSLDNVESSSKDAKEGFTVMKGALSELVADGIRVAAREMKDLALQTFEAGSSFESQMSKVSAISGATGEDFEKLKKKAMEMGGSTKFTATEAGEALEYMAMAGWKTDDMLNGLEGIMNLAAASGEDLGTTSDIVTDALTAFGMEAKDAGHFADILAAASSNANTNVSMMGESFKYVAPVAGALGFSAEDVSVALGLMANSGIKASTAGTTLRTILSNMAKPTDEMAGAMQELGVSLDDGNGNMKSLAEIMGDLREGFKNTKIPMDEFQSLVQSLDQDLEDGTITEDEYNEQLQYLAEKAYGAEGALKAQTAASLAGARGMSGLLAIVNASEEDYDKLTAAINNCDGAAGSMADTMNDNVAGKLTLLKSQIEGIMIKVFDEASDSMKTGIEAISKALDKVDWDKFAEGVGQFAEKVADLVVYLIDHSEEVMNVLKGIATAFVTYKGVQTVNNVHKEFSSLFQLITGTGLPTISGFGGAIAALPFAALAGSIGAVIIADKKYADSVQAAIDKEYGLTEAQKKTIEKGSELAAAYETNRKSSIEYKKAIDNEYLGIDDLVDEYDSLLDEHGRVKRGNEERATFIKTTLADALGIEVSAIDAIVKENGKLSNSIDEIIIKRKAEALLNADEAQYQEAKAKSAEMTLAYADSVGVAEDAEAKYQKALKDLSEAQKKNTEFIQKNGHANGELQDDVENAKIAVEQAKEQWKESTKAVEEQGAELAKLNADIENHEGLAAAIIEGDAKRMEEASERVTNGFVSSKEGSRKALEDQASESAIEYAKIKRAYEAGAAGVTESMVAEYQSRSAKAAAELDTFVAQEKEKMGDAGSGGVFSLKEAWNNNSGDVYDMTYGTGSEMGSGVDAGLNSWADKIFSDMRSLVRGAINAGNDEADIHSPSKETTKTGANMGQGLVNGLQSTASQLKKTTRKIIRDMIDEFGNGQGQAMAAIAQTDVALQRQLDSLERNHDKTAAKIQRKIDKLEKKGKDLTKAEKKELKELKKELKAENKEYENAVKELNNSVSDMYVSAAEERMQKLKKQNKVTLSEEVTFWREIVDHTKKGTDAWETASDKLRDAKNALANEAASLTENFMKDAASVLDNYSDVVASRADKLANSFNLFKAAEVSEDSPTGKRLISNLRSQIRTLESYEETIESLANRLGNDNPLYEALKEEGVDSLNILQTIDEMDDEELERYSELYAKRAKVAKRIAEQENERLKDQAEDQIMALQDAYMESIFSLTDALTDESKDVGKAITAGIAQGLEDGSSDMTKAMKKQIQALVKETKQDLGIASPSKVYRDEIGKMLPPGIAEGFEDAAPGASSDIQQTLNEMTNGLTAGINGATFGRQLNSYGAFTPTSDFAQILAKIDQLMSVVEKSGDRQIVLDSGELVGATIAKTDQALQNAYALRERGV